MFIAVSEISPLSESSGNALPLDSEKELEKDPSSINTSPLSGFL